MKNMEKAKKEIEKLIKEDFKINYYMEDFLYGYMNANDIEEDELTDEQMEEFIEIMKEPGFLRHFRETCIEEINERLTYLF